MDCEHCHYSDSPLPTDELEELLRDFMQWIYRQLEAEYEYQTSDEAIAENFTANETEFDADGNLA